MICRQCLQRIARRDTIRAFSQSTRQAASAVSAQTTTATNPRPNDRPAATSTAGAAQPFSTPLTPKPNRQDLPISTKQTKAAAKLPASSVPAGTVLKGLNFMKNQGDMVALEDDQYPPWLWSVLDQKQEGDKPGETSEGDLFAKSKKQRQRAAKALRKQQLLNPEALAPKVPLYEQSVDLPSGDGSVEGAMEAGEARGELVKSMRGMRRSKIKEANFLRSMR